MVHSCAVSTRLLPAFAFLISMQAAQGQSLRQALEPRLAELSSKSHSAILLWELSRSEALAAVRADVFAAPRCLGSLVKPFLLLAYLNERCGDPTSNPRGVPPCPRTDDLTAPQTSRGPSEGIKLQPCVGYATSECPVECWYKPGHGNLETSRALAVSCNQYFYQLSKHTSPATFFRALAALGISTSADLASRASVTAETMIGLDSTLKLSPLQVLKAYGVLISGHPVCRNGKLRYTLLRAGDSPRRPKAWPYGRHF